MSGFHYDIWTTWSFDASVLIPLVAAAAAYGIAAYRRGWSWVRALVFYAGLAVVLVALQSVIDAVGDCCLFAVHMAQHMLLLLVAPALIAYGLKGILPHPRGPVARILAWLTLPAVAIGLPVANLYLWHLPLAYELTLRFALVHDGEHLSYVLTGLLLWWPVLEPVPIAGRKGLTGLGKLSYLVVQGAALLPLGLVLLVAAHSLYPYYLHVPRPSGWTALFDQQMGGVVMLWGGAIIMAGSLIGGFMVTFGLGGATTARASGAIADAVSAPLRSAPGTARWNAPVVGSSKDRAPS